MTADALVQLLAEHGENYDADGYHGCDCGYACGAAVHPYHVAEVLRRVGVVAC